LFVGLFCVCLTMKRWNRCKSSISGYMYTKLNLILIIPVKVGWNCTSSFWEILKFCDERTDRQMDRHSTKKYPYISPLICRADTKIIHAMHFVVLYMFTFQYIQILRLTYFYTHFLYLNMRYIWLAFWRPVKVIYSKFYRIKTFMTQLQILEN
jgi:hypothetical protein